jgi:type I restriction enzyme S subunit
VAVQFSQLSRWGRERNALVQKVPNGWRILKLHELLQQVNVRTRVVEEQEYRLCGVKWYGEGVFERETCHGAELSASQLYPLVEGRLIYNRLFAWKASFAVVPPECDGLFVSNEFPQFAVDESLAVAEYVRLYCLSNAFIAAVKKASEGSAAVSRNRFKEVSFLGFEIPLPPLSKQKAIVAQWQKLQVLIAEAEQIANQHEERAREVFLAALGLHKTSLAQSRKCFALKWSTIGRWGIETNQPDAKLDVSAGHYPVTILADVIHDLTNGWSPKCLDRPAEGTEWGVLKLGAVSYGAFDPTANKGLPTSLTPQPALEIKTGDWLISRANITRLVGACALVGETPPRLMLCDKIFRAVWRPNSPVLPAYLDEVMKAPHLRQQIEASLTGTSPTMKNISKPALLALRLPLPPLDVQQTLITAIGQARADALALRQQAKQLREQAKREIEAALLGKG